MKYPMKLMMAAACVLVALAVAPTMAVAEDCIGELHGNLNACDRDFEKGSKSNDKCVEKAGKEYDRCKDREAKDRDKEPAGPKDKDK